MEEIERILERERAIGEKVYEFLLSDGGLPLEIQQEMQVNPPTEYGANSFYIDNIKKHFDGTYVAEFDVQIDGEDLKLLIEVSCNSNSFFIYYRESPKALAYKNARAILEEKRSVKENKTPSQWSLCAAERIKNELLTCRWTLGEFEYICSMYRDLMEYEGGSLSAGFTKGPNPSDYKHGTTLEIYATCADELNLVVINCLLQIFHINISHVVNENGDYHAICRIRK